MKFQFTISRKISLGFGLITFVSLFNTLLIVIYLNKSTNLNNSIGQIYQPSIQHIESLEEAIIDSRMYIKNWVFIEKSDISADKIKFKEIIDIEIPANQLALNKYAEMYWDSTHLNILSAINKCIDDSIIVFYQKTIEKLSNQNAYNDNEYISKINLIINNKGEYNKNLYSVTSKLNLLKEYYSSEVKNINSQIEDTYKRAYQIAIVFSLIFILLAIVISLLTIGNLIKPINYIKNTLISMSKGILPPQKIKESNDEIGEMSGALNSLVQGLKDISEFATEIGKGNFDSNFSPLSDKDTLGNSLIKMREELKYASSEDEKRKKEDSQRNWATHGIAKFGEILRQNNDNLNELSFNIISNLVNYLEANQGGLFILNEQNNGEYLLELSSSYAFNRKKFLEKKIEKGEGLVGRCFQEAETINLSEIPNEYIKITSGLGEDNPRSLLLVPLLLNDEVYGVIELASFETFQSYQVEFVEKIAASIASTIKAVKINMQTSKLLTQSRQQAEEMASQEEEMRQNMEELRSTQEETERKELKMQQELEYLRAELNKYK